MNREIKFRVWSSGNMLMLHQAMSKGLIKSDGFVLLPNKGTILMQYVGLSDINGRNIYEGDILRDGGLIAPCVYNTDYACFEFATDKMVNVELDMCEVIGNIYENPNLLVNEEVA